MIDCSNFFVTESGSYFKSSGLKALGRTKNAKAAALLEESAERSQSSKKDWWFTELCKKEGKNISYIFNYRYCKTNAQSSDGW